MQFPYPLGIRSAQIAALAIFVHAVSARASFTLNWVNNDVPSNETGFGIERSNAGGSFVQIATVLPAVTTYQDTTVTNTLTYSYRVRAFNTAGYSAYTNVVTNPPLFTTQPAASQAVVAGGTITLTAATSDVPVPAYQWQVSTNGGAIWSNLTNSGIYSGAGSTSLTITGATVAMSNYQYQAVAINAGGAATSNTDTLTVATIPVIGSQPASDSVAAGGNAVFAASASGSPAPAYQWQVSTNSGATWTSLTNAGVYANVTSPQLVITGATASMNGFEYHALAINAAAPSGVASSAATLAVTSNQAPIFTTSPANQLVSTGAIVRFTATASGTPAPTYQWQVSANAAATWTNVTNSNAYSGVTTTTLAINGAAMSLNNYEYRAVATNTGGSADSNAGILAVTLFTVQPVSNSVTAGGNVTFTASTGSNPVKYKWEVSTNGGITWTALTNAGVYSGVSTASLTITGATAAMSGNEYQVIVTGSATPNGLGSSIVMLTVNPVVLSNLVRSPIQSAISTISAAPSFTAQPTSQTVTNGSTVTFNALSTGNPAPRYQWLFNGTPIAGATGARLLLNNATAENATGTYTCTATNTWGAATSSAATLAFTSTSDIGRLINLSVLNQAGSTQALTLGFVIGGTGTTGSESLLIRASGPALSAFGLSGVLLDPTLTVLSGSNVIGYNDNWGSPANNQALVRSAEAAVSAFPLTNPNSLDAALVTSPAGNAAYTVQIGGNGPSSGIALGEVYDSTPSDAYTPATPRLINLSSMTSATAGGSLTTGFILGGSSSKTVLIRATGPALAALGQSGTMADPQLALHTTVSGQDQVLAANAGWGGDSQITAVGNAVSAFPLTDPLSHDSAVLITLPPGAYTVEASSSSGGAGVVLTEVYEVP